MSGGGGVAVTEPMESDDEEAPEARASFTNVPTRRWRRHGRRLAKSHDRTSGQKRQCTRRCERRDKLRDRKQDQASADDLDGDRSADSRPLGAVHRNSRR